MLLIVCTHGIHGTGISSYIMFMVNVGKYSINESYGVNRFGSAGPSCSLSSLVSDFFRDFGVSSQGSD